MLYTKTSNDLSTKMSIESRRGSFRTKFTQHDILNAQWDDLVNPYNFFALMNTTTGMFISWMQKQGLLAQSMPCQVCNQKCKLGIRTDVPDGYCWRCPKKHRTALRTNTFFEKSQFSIQDIILFVKLYLDKMTLGHISLQTGMNYSNTCVQWGVYVREIFKEYFYQVSVLYYYNIICLC